MPLNNVIEVKTDQNGHIRLTGGTDAAVLNILSKVLDFQFNLSIPEDKEWGRLAADGHWTGMVGMVMRSEADLAISLISKDGERESVIDFCEPILYNELTFVTHLPRTRNRTLAFIYPFDYITWICLACAIVFMPFLFQLIYQKTKLYSDLFLGVYASLVRQGVNENIFGGRLLTCFWWLAAMIISFSYTSVLFSFLAVPLVDQPVRSFRELAMAVEVGRYKALVNRGTLLIPVFKSSQKEDLIKIAEVMEKNDWFVNIIDYLSEKYFDGKTAFIGPRSLFQFRFGKAPLTTKYISEDTAITIDSSIITGKKFCCKKAIDLTILRMKKTGILLKITNDQLFKSWLHETSKKRASSTEHSISLNDIIGPVALLSIGIGLSIVILFAEIICKKTFG
ncbi:glutamate receptor ionotropic, delta-1-like [Parasteatoda tepidariorum]|uniref:glutamate receptor ionotropic, delta-1-like n=1 Tax=Parasteatoda tepidariorum TaxID=114398 RepID=UPI001C72424E|nr:glutamate receptor ionotropic, delta-1-like [Parasteatoda tepidariorum]